MHFADSFLISLLFKSDECSPGDPEYTGFVMLFAEDTLQRSSNSLGCFLRVFISSIARSYLLIIAIILMHMSEWNESTNCLISVTRASLYANCDEDAFNLSTERNNTTEETSH